MKIPYSWLKELVDIDVAPDRLAADLASIGIEVASIAETKVPEGVIVAKILGIGKHPNADRLSICEVDAGGLQPEKIVCGAPNVRPGMLAPLATVGSRLGPDMVVEKAKIRGVDSAGMLCSERELSISDNHSGIMELPADYTPGTALKKYFPDDAVLEIEITPNRGDCLSMLGVARECAAKYGRTVKSCGRTPLESCGSINDYISVEIVNSGACPRYLGRLVRGVTIADSPEWLKRRIRACGLRPINNIVDITNYILLLFGQPMHAFDYSRIAGRSIIVKNAADGQLFITLDGMERNLCRDDLLICDAEKAVAIAGVMGGANSHISATTRDVFLECAYFEPAAIRRTSKRLDLSTDASYRFERGVDPADGLIAAIDTAAELIRRLAGGEIIGGRIDAYPKPLTPRRIILRPSQVQRLLGVDISRDRIVSLLGALGIRLIGGQGGAMEFEAPLYRHDLVIEADLIEEVGRLYGYDNIPPSVTAPVTMTRTIGTSSATADTIRKVCAFQGLHETVTGSMTSEKRRALLTPDIKPVVLLNPLSPDMAQMRTTLAGSLLEVVAYNLNRKNTNNRFFEIGKTFASRGLQELPDERDVVAIIIEGFFEAPSWQHPGKPVDFYILKSLINSLARHCGAGPVRYGDCGSAAAFFGQESATVACGTTITGECGKMREDICAAFDIATPVYYAQLDITALVAAPPSQPVYSPLPRYPAVERDFCFVVPEQMRSAVICDEIAAVSDLVEWVEPFDVYRGEKLGPGLKSIACALRLRAPDRTLTDTEADEICGRIIETMRRKHGATLRR